MASHVGEAWETAKPGGAFDFMDFMVQPRQQFIIATKLIIGTPQSGVQLLAHTRDALTGIGNEFLR